MEAVIAEARDRGDTVGGTIGCVIDGIPVGLGQPVFDKLNADLAKAMLSINAVKGFEIGSGIAGTYRYGSEENDSFIIENETVRTATNNSGGIQGGISNGMPIRLAIHFKPVATIQNDQNTVDQSGELSVIKGKGRHDPCVLPRAVPIVEAMAALVIADHVLRARSDRA
jgi:chorismate synthase